MECCWDPVILIMEEFFLFSIIAHRAGLALTQRNTCKNRSLRTNGGKSQQHFPHIVFRIGFLIGKTGQKAGFCDIGISNICNSTEIRVFLCIMLIESGIQFSVISHCRIDKDERVIVPEVFNDTDHGVYFLFSAKISGINCVECDPFLFPMISNRFQLIRQVFAREPFKKGVRAEDSRRQYRRFDPHRRQKRQSNRQGAFAEAGNVLDSQYSFHVRIPSYSH